MTTLRDDLRKCKKGTHLEIDGTPDVVAGTATIHPMGRKTRGGQFLLIPNAPEIRLVWTAGGYLIWNGPRYEGDKESCWMILSREKMETIDFEELCAEASVFGVDMKQKQKTVRFKYQDLNLWFTDVGTAGASDIPVINEGDVVAGPACLRFYHLTENWEKDESKHLLYIGPSTNPSEFSDGGGEAWDTLWTGTVCEPEDRIQMEVAK